MIQFLSLKVNNFLKLFCIILLVYSKFLFIFTFYDNFYHADLCLHMSPQTLSVSPRVFCRVTPSTREWYNKYSQYDKTQIPQNNNKKTSLNEAHPTQRSFLSFNYLFSFFLSSDVSILSFPLNLSLTLG